MKYLNSFIHLCHSKINDAPFQMSTGKIQLGINTDHAINYGTVYSVETTTLIHIEGKRHCRGITTFFNILCWMIEIVTYIVQ